MEEQKMKKQTTNPVAKVAIVYCQDNHNDYFDDYIIQSISDWQEVSEEELKLIKTYYSSANYSIDGYPKLIVYRETPSRERATLDKMIAAARKTEEDYKNRRRKQEEEKEKKAKQRKERTVAEEKKLLEELKAKYEKEKAEQK